MANYAYTDYYFVGSKNELLDFVGIISEHELSAQLGISEIKEIEQDYSKDVFRVFVSTQTKWSEYTEGFKKIIKDNLFSIRMHWICEELGCSYFAKSAGGDFYFPFKYLFEADLVSEGGGEIFKEYFETESALVDYANEILEKRFKTMEDVEMFADEINKLHNEDYVVVLKAEEK